MLLIVFHMWRMVLRFLDVDYPGSRREKMNMRKVEWEEIDRWTEKKEEEMGSQ